MTVCLPGTAGSFSSRRRWVFRTRGAEAAVPVFDEVFRAVEASQADVGVVPVEIHTEGAVNRSLDACYWYAAQDPGRAFAGDPSLPDVEIRRHGRHQGHRRPPAKRWPVLGLADPQLSRRRARGRFQQFREKSGAHGPADPSVAAIAGAKWPRRPGNCRWWPPASGRSAQPHAFLAIGYIRATLVGGQNKTSLILAVPNRAGAV